MLKAKKIEQCRGKTSQLIASTTSNNKHMHCSMIFIIMIRMYQPCFIIIFSETSFMSMIGDFFKDTILLTGTFS
jgi:hypothetical protein